MAGKSSSKKKSHKKGSSKGKTAQQQTEIHPLDWKRRAREELGETPEIRAKTLKVSKCLRSDEVCGCNDWRFHGCSLQLYSL